MNMNTVRDVAFSPMPAPKPTGGFIEIGEYDGSAYAFESSVELLAGSDGRVYAVVAEHISDLPDLDGEGRPLWRGGLEKDGVNTVFIALSAAVKQSLSHKSRAWNTPSRACALAPTCLHTLVDDRLVGLPLTFSHVDSSWNVGCLPANGSDHAVDFATA